MKREMVVAMSLCCLMYCTHSLEAKETVFWPTFRGPVNTGVAPDADPPVVWSESENIKWKVALPSKGSSSPVIWGDRIFFLTAVPTETAEEEKPAAPPETQSGPDNPPDPSDKQGQRRSRMSQPPKSIHTFDVVCLDRKSGRMLWQKTVKEELPHEGHHRDASFASYSPVTDGQLVWASFGSRGLYCFDVDGTLKWSQDLVKQRTRAGFGEGSSPVIAGEAIVVVADHEDQSYIYAFDKLSGRPLWKKERDEASSWATPIAVDVAGQMQVIANGRNFVRGYDLKTGEVLWKCSGQTENVIPTPVVGFGKVYCASGFRGSALQAIELGRTGDLTGTDAVRWQVNEATPYVPSPILINDKLYFCSNNKAIISCYQAEDGKANFTRQALEGPKGIYASPVGALDRVYFAGRNGVTVVVKVSDTYEVLATNTLDDGFDATPAIVGDEIYLKGNQSLYCIAKK
ncbi:MAG: PQQ-binding-like beta-propeller repeat protein [Planctomycetota bacterium]